MGNPTKDLQRFLCATEPAMTQQAFAELVGVTQPAVNKWLRGRATPSLKAALVIERITKIPFESWKAEWAALRRRVA